MYDEPVGYGVNPTITCNLGYEKKQLEMSEKGRVLQINSLQDSFSLALQDGLEPTTP